MHFRFRPCHHSPKIDVKHFMNERPRSARGEKNPVIVSALYIFYTLLLVAKRMLTILLCKLFRELIKKLEKLFFEYF